MRKKDYLEQLRKLLDVNLAKADADDAYAYYIELFDEEEFGILVERIGRPEDVVHRLLEEEMEVSLYSARHSIRRGARLLGRMLSDGGKGCILAVLDILLMVVVTLVSALADGSRHACIGTGGRDPCDEDRHIHEARHPSDAIHACLHGHDDRACHRRDNDAQAPALSCSVHR